ERQNGANSGDSDGGQPTDPSPGSRAEREMVIEAVLSAAKSLGLKKAAEQRGRFPGRSQWQGLRHRVEAVTSSDDNGLQKKIARIFQDLAGHAGTLGGNVWAFPVAGDEPLHAAIKQRVEEQETALRQRMFLIYLCRWVVARLDRLADQQRRKDRGEENPNDE
ncbi:MAG: hypothetical protein ACQESR_19215, partial [Planctomycetota bacterium]